MRKVALITGGNRGLGHATARTLARAGFLVLLGARDSRQGERAAAALRAEGLEAEAVALDVTSAASVAAAAEQVRREHGRLDVLVNNAGILPEATAGDGARPVSARLFEQTLATNVVGAVRVVEAFLPLLDAAGGRIVNVSSTMGSLSDQTDPSSPYHGVLVPAYQASKAALNSVTIGLAKALGDTGIKVNAVCPGYVQTDLTPANRDQAPLTADEASHAVAAMALIGDDGPSGGFVDRSGTVAW
jgi:NAD(P)-dependent dehydrogenase (short-subunit alcohol dehydrogenase family)